MASITTQTTSRCTDQERKPALKDIAVRISGPATPIPAVLRWKGHPAQSYHADLFLGESPNEVIIRFEHPEANQPPVIWIVPRELFTLVREVQPGYSGIVSNIWALAFGPQNREHGWTQISPLDGPFTVDLWDATIGEFFAKLSQVVPGTTLEAIQLRVQY